MYQGLSLLSVSLHDDEGVEAEKGQVIFGRSMVSAAASEYLFDESPSSCTRGLFRFLFEAGIPSSLLKPPNTAKLTENKFKCESHQQPYKGEIIRCHLLFTFLFFSFCAY